MDEDEAVEDNLEVAASLGVAPRTAQDQMVCTWEEERVAVIVDADGAEGVAGEDEGTEIEHSRKSRHRPQATNKTQPTHHHLLNPAVAASLVVA